MTQAALYVISLSVSKRATEKKSNIVFSLSSHSWNTIVISKLFPYLGEGSRSYPWRRSQTQMSTTSAFTLKPRK